MDCIDTTQDREEGFPLERIGVFKFTNNRLDELVNHFKIFTKNMEDETILRAARWIVTQLYLENFNYKEVEKFSKAIGLPSDFGEGVYSNYNENHSLYSFEKEVMDTIPINDRKPKEYYSQYMREFSDIIVTASITDNISVQIDEDEYITIDIRDKCVRLDTQKRIKGKPTQRRGKLLLTLAPIRVVEYSTSVKNPKPLFKWSFEDSMGYRFTTEPQSLKETVDLLKERGYVVQTKNLPGTLNACLLSLKQTRDNRCYVKRPPLLCKGFHYIDGKIIVENYDLETPSDEEILEAIETLEEYKTWFIPEEYTYLSTTFKWGLFAPFSYAYKSKRNSSQFVKWLYLHGEGRVGKTNGYGKFVSHLWFDEPQLGFENYMESFRTIPRFRNIISKNTFPILMNETAAALEKNGDLKEMFKNCVEGLTITKTLGDNAGEYQAYSPAICTSNGFITDDSGAISGRIISMVFSQKMSEAKHGKDIEFDATWKIGNVTSPLNKLRAISHEFARIMMDHPEYLNLGYEKVTDNVLEKVYAKVGKSVPDWLKEWVSNEESYLLRVSETKQDMAESIQMIINEQRLQNDNGNPIDYVKNVLGYRKIVGLYLKKDGYVYLTQKFLDNLYRRKLMENPQKLSQFAESYGWSYENKTTNFNGSRQKACRKPYDVFINEIYDLDFSEQIEVL